jgi:transcriptional regulator GlxA family with amidase domain
VVAAACRFIHEQAHRPLAVGEVAAALGTGRRTLERRFRHRLGRGLAAEIRRCHVERAKELLTDQHLTLSTVATRAGFASAKQLTVAFRRSTGLTPQAWRNRR